MIAYQRRPQFQVDSDPRHGGDINNGGNLQVKVLAGVRECECEHGESMSDLPLGFVRTAIS